MEYLKEAIGPKNQEYYLKHFQRFEDRQGISTTWNWATLFFSFFWFIYRKLYLLALLCLVLPIPYGLMLALDYATPYNLKDISSNYLIAIGVLMLLVFPLFANKIYYSHLQKKIKYFTRKYEDETKCTQKIVSVGGTNKWLLIITLVFFISSGAAIAAVITIPIYEDNQRKEIVVTAIQLATDYRATVENYFNQQQRYPRSNLDVNLPTLIANPNIENILILEKGIVMLKLSGDRKLKGKSIKFVPTTQDGHIIGWQCLGLGIRHRYLPKDCAYQ